MIAVVLALSGLGLLALPAWARPAGRRLPPSEWSRLAATALVGGALAVETGLALLAAPTVLRAARVPTLAAACERMLGHLSPGGPTVGWMTGAAAIAIAVMAASGILRAHGIYRAVRVERWVGEHETRSNYELVVIPSPHLLAVSVAGRQPQVIVSTGLIETLLPEELEAVVRHECAHLDRRHQRYLLLARAVDAGFRFLPFVRRSTAAVRIGLERWADEVAAGETAEGRQTVREALLMTTAAVVGSELAAFSAAESVIERLEALDGTQTEHSLVRRSAVYLPAIALALVATMAMVAWLLDARMVVAMTGLCAA